jgi:hypothetical protein
MTLFPPRPSQQQPAAASSKRVRPGSYDLQGFTNFWGRSRQGFWVVKRKTARGRPSRAFTTIGQWCRLSRHQPLAERHQALSEKLRGHFGYYGITGTSFALSRFPVSVIRIWMKWLARRRRRGLLPWLVIARLLRRYPLPAGCLLGLPTCKPGGDLASRLPKLGTNRFVGAPGNNPWLDPSPFPPGYPARLQGTACLPAISSLQSSCNHRGQKRLLPQSALKGRKRQKRMGVGRIS